MSSNWGKRFTPKVHGSMVGVLRDAARAEVERLEGAFRRHPDDPGLRQALVQAQQTKDQLDQLPV